VTEAKGTFPGGFIVRTRPPAQAMTKSAPTWNFWPHLDTIRATSEQRRAPSLLHRDLNLVERILRDYLSDDYVAIWSTTKRNSPRSSNCGPLPAEDGPAREAVHERVPIFEEFGIQQELDKAAPESLAESGGYIVINHTEALVAIDVNTGKYVGRGSTRLEDTIVKTNLEAVKESSAKSPARPRRHYVVDFIDMEERRTATKSWPRSIRL